MPPPAARLLVEQRGDGHVADGLGDGEGFEDASEVLRAAVGLDYVEPFAEHHQPDAAVLVDEEAGDGGGGGDGGLDRGVVALAEVLAAGEVEHDPEMGGGVELEGFDFERAGAQAALPVDAVDAVAGLVIADAGGVGGDVVGASAEAALAGQVGGRHGVAGEVERLGVDDQGASRAEAEFAGEDVEGIAAAHHDGAEVVEAASAADGLQPPGAASAHAERGDEARAVAGQLRAFFELEPELGDARLVDDFKALDDQFAGLHAVAAARHAHAQAESGGPGPEHRQSEAEEQGVAEPQGQPVVGSEADGEADDGEDDDDRERASADEEQTPGAGTRGAQAAHLGSALPAAGQDAPAREPGTATRSSTSSITVRAS